MPAADTVITAVGARTAGGFNALQVVLSLRAGQISPFQTHIIDQYGEAVAVCRLRSIGDNVQGLKRFVALGAPALAEAAAMLPVPPRPLPLVLALPEPARPGVDRRLQRELLTELSAASGVPLDMTRSELIMTGRAGGVEAFRRAMQQIASGAEDVLVGGIDSYFDPDVLEALDQERRLHSMTTENGFIPAEGAAFVVLSARRSCRGRFRYGRLHSAVTAPEPRPFGSDEPCLGDAITQVVRQASSAVGTRARRIGWAMTDVANERHRVEEWGYAFARCHQAFTADAFHEQPLLNLGDVGAASAALLLCTAAVRWQTGCAAGDCVLIATHSDGASRGALVASQEGA